MTQKGCMTRDCIQASIYWGRWDRASTPTTPAFFLTIAKQLLDIIPRRLNT